MNFDSRESRNKLGCLSFRIKAQHLLPEAQLYWAFSKQSFALRSRIRSEACFAFFLPSFALQKLLLNLYTYPIIRAPRTG